MEDGGKELEVVEEIEGGEEFEEMEGLEENCCCAKHDKFSWIF